MPMETEQTFYLSEDFPAPPYSELTAKELETVKRYVELVRHLEEIHQLFLIFKFNLDAFFSDYRITSSGKVFCNDVLANTDDDYIAINALVISIISAGKTMVESMRAYTKANYGEGSEIHKKLEAFIQNIYDHVFAYRLLVRLRDYAQHGHLPVNKDGDWYGFDARTLVGKPHFKHNEKIRKELEAAVKEVAEKYGDSFKMSLADMLAQYTPKLLSICQMFWNEVEEDLLKTGENFRNVVAAHPENVFGQKECPPGLFSYNLVDGNLDIAFLGDAPKLLIQTCKREEEKFCEKYEAAWKDYGKDRTIFGMTEDGNLETQSFEKFMEG